jgi:hypothetical protein
MYAVTAVAIGIECSTGIRAVDWLWEDDRWRPLVRVLTAAIQVLRAGVAPGKPRESDSILGVAGEKWRIDKRRCVI